ncbi:MAG: hypothetical protein ACHQRM_15215 [Bacteroidia bacterium]
MEFLILRIIIMLCLPITPGLKTKLIKHLEGKFSSIASDELQNLYLVKAGVIEKYDPDGKLLYSFSNNTLGPVTSVDAADPMKILVFYGPYVQFAILDNTLSLTADPVQLQNFGYEQVSLACISYDKGYWLYNPGNFELIHMSASDLAVNKSTGNIPQLTHKPLAPNFLLEQNNKVFLNDPAQGILVFDSYGTYYKTVVINGLDQFQVNGDKIIYLQKKNLMTYDYKTLVEETIPLPDSTVQRVRIEKERLFIQNPEGVDIYEVK